MSSFAFALKLLRKFSSLSTFVTLDTTGGDCCIVMFSFVFLSFSKKGVRFRSLLVTVKSI
ncbi:hypothetical protein GASC598B02_005120 [Gilliamella apicola SCGC AB-598-B02]|nr:hypothetical protein GASC598B02_002320 [Gilliamella apicola SCGC AB-598-B02]KES15083.1 hypothetical protein GASC598B02_005120 [Gilliamella apicola SCGC AB-598-B02]